MTAGQSRAMRRPRARHAAFTIAVGGALVLAACSSSGGSGNGGGATNAGTGGATTGGGSTTSSCPTANKKLNLAFIYATTSQNPMQEMALGAKAAADQDGNVNLQELAPADVDGAKEVQMLQAATRTATDGIAWESVTPDVFLRPLQAVKDAKIPLVAVDNMTPKGVEPDLLVSNSNTELGVDLGNAFVAQNPDPNGTVVEGNDIPTLQLLVQRMDGFTSVVKAKLPNMKIIGPFDAKGSAGLTANTTAWQAAVNAHPDATAFIGVGGPDGISLPLIKKNTGGKWLAGSADIPPQALEGVKSGALFALSSPEHFLKGYFAIYQIIQHARTCKPMPTGWWNSGNLLIDKTNIDAVIARQKDNAARMEFFKPEIAKQLANPPLHPFSELN